MDVVALAQQGLDYAVATLGTATTGEHLERVFRSVPELVFCFDGDKAGRQAAWRALELALPSMRDGREAKFLLLPEGEDPDSLVQKEGRDGFEKRLEASVPLAEYLLEELSKKVDTATIGGRVRLIELARPLIKKLPPGLYGELLEQQLCALAKLDRQNLHTILADETDGRPTRPAPPSHQRISMTPIRTAIALLIRQPSLVAELAPQEEALRLEQAGIAVLQEIVKIARGNTELHSGALLEHFRDSPEAPALAKLASWELPVSGNDREAAERREFVDAIARLRTAYNRQRTAALLRESQNHTLSPDAKTELQSRLRR
jgi:DNA primase